MLADLLGGATRDLYESIFAVHVEELAELKALTDDQVETGCSPPASSAPAAPRRRRSPR